MNNIYNSGSSKPFEPYEFRRYRMVMYDRDGNTRIVANEHEEKAAIEAGFRESPEDFRKEALQPVPEPQPEIDVLPEPEPALEPHAKPGKLKSHHRGK